MKRRPVSTPSSTDRLLQRARRHLENHPFLKPGDGLVVAVSGGPDSVALLDVLHRLSAGLRLSLVVAHLNHGLRGSDADDDEAFVGNLAGRPGLPFHSRRTDVASIAARSRLSVEEAARNERRGFLESVRLDTGSAAIALGHTRNDQAETMLMNLLRGAGPRGLAGMPEYGPEAYTRPLIGSSRAEVLDYLMGAGIEYREDATNLDRTIHRNLIRHEVLPYLERLNPNLVETLTRQADLFLEVDACLADLAGEFLSGAARLEAGSMRLERDRLARQPPAIRRAILREAVSRLLGDVSGWGREPIDAVMEMLEKPGTGRRELPGGVMALMDGESVLLTAAGGGEPPEEAPGPVLLALTHGAECMIQGRTLRVAIHDLPIRSEAVVIPDGCREAWFDAAGLTEPLHVRRLRPGDRIRPFGTGGSRKVSDVLIDRKVPRIERGRLFALVGRNEDREDLLWIPGVQRSNVAPVTPATLTVARFEWFGAV